ncbi:unnamed protein product [Linum trigynum]|uniref:Retrotransposon Copia-like N-terminal domain-containing protein n=1 Tax=Linum trigynum TaxID=586398 RepID=A0AAV2E3J0_9ROSI
MNSSKLEAAPIKFNGINFSLWEFQFRTIIEGKCLLPILNGKCVKPSADAPNKDRDDWAAANAQVTHWLLAFVDVPTALGLRQLETTHEMWVHICSMNSQYDASRQFELETQLASLAQGDLDVRGYYKKALHIWTEHDLLMASITPTAISANMVKERNRSRLMHFLMRLRPEFEAVRASLLHRNVATIDAVFGELVREETHMKSQTTLDQSSHHSETAFAVGRHGSSHP